MDTATTSSYLDQKLYLVMEPDNSGTQYHYWDDVKVFLPGSTGWQVFSGELMGDEDELYEFRIRTMAGANQGKVTNLDIKHDVYDIVEYVDDFSVAATGSIYLSSVLENTYREVVSCLLTVQDDGGTGISAVCIDKNPGSGNLCEVEVYNTSGTRVAGTVDALVKGY